MIFAIFWGFQNIFEFYVGKLSAGSQVFSLYLTCNPVNLKIIYATIIFL